MATKKLLLFSYNPVPTPQYKTIEGSALRFWRMALGLKNNGGYDITIAVWEKFPQEYSESDGFKIVNFNSDINKLHELTLGFDAVVVSCAMGNLSKIIFDSINSKVLRIIDAYSPMYVEFLTKSNDKKEDKDWIDVYDEYIGVFNELLIRADYILIGNMNQKHFYRGALGAIGGLVSHDDNRFIEFPAFVEQTRHESRKDETKDGRLNILWFGGVYPWFDIIDLINALADEDIRKISRLTIVGGSNPFYPKDNKRFNGKYIEAVEAATKLGLIDDGTIVLRDWVEYDDRIKLFDEADVAITINNTFIENEYSFRLRVADLAGNGVPIITNGGDYLGENLIKSGVAFRMGASGEELKMTLKEILQDKEAIRRARKKLSSGDIYNQLHIDYYIPRLTAAINTAKKNKNRNLPKIEEAKPTEDSRIPEYNIFTVKQVSTARLVQVTLIRVKRAMLSKLGVKKYE